MEKTAEFQEIRLKVGEAKTIKFFYHNGTSAKTPVNVSSGTFNFELKEKKTGSAIISKDNTKFDKTDAADGIVTLILQKADTSLLNANTERYLAEVKVVFNATDDIDKSADIDVFVIEPVHQEP